MAFGPGVRSIHTSTLSSPHSEITRRIDTKIVPRIPSDTYNDAPGTHPLQHDTDPWTITTEVLPHCTGGTRSDAVYVLECFPNSDYQQTAATKLGHASQRWVGDVDGAQRLIYVGMTVNLIRRLDEHLNDASDWFSNAGGSGAHFTTVFPPVRVLDVSWWHSHIEAMRAEEYLAERLQKRFTEDYVYQS